MKFKKQLLAVLVLLLTTRSYSQVNFENGYFIDLEGKRTDCLIKNYDWQNNPGGFEYKLSDGDAPQKVFASAVKEFGIDQKSKYQAIDVSIDRSSGNLNELTFERNPVWTKERLFLRVLVESRISLLSYVDGSLKRFFYQIQDTVKQLVYKKYLDQNYGYQVNYGFRQQLSIDVKCGSTTDAELKRVVYDRNSLARYFRDYNECAGADITDFSKGEAKGSFHVKITPGINYSSLKAYYSESLSYPWDVDFEAQLDARIGCELEYILPFNKNKWGMVVEPSYQTFKAKDRETRTMEATVNTFEIPLGIRYYFFLSGNSRIFINGLYVLTFPGKSSIDLRGSNYGATAPAGIAIGSGIDFKRFSGEIRYFKNGDVLNEDVLWKGDFNRLSFILGYRLF